MVKAVLIPVSDGLRRFLPVAVGCVFLWLLWTKTQDLDWQSVRTAFDAIPRWRWLAALTATAASFWAVAQYDVIAHRHLRTGVDERAARQAGAAAIALGQTTGFGPVIGGAIRWRLMPALGHTEIANLTGFVTLGFLAAWGVLTLSIGVPVLLGLGWVAIFTFAALSLIAAAALVRYPKHRIFGFDLTLPSLPAMTQMTALAACDLLGAGLALHLLLPPDIAPPFFMLVAAFSVALGAGMIGGTPGGLGPFEVALVALMPNADLAPLAAALVAFRIVYYLIPCLIGLAYAALAPITLTQRPQAQTAPLDGPRPEHCIASLSDTLPVRSNNSQGCALRTPQTLSLFLGPTRGHLADLLAPLKAQARAENRIACLYKLTAKDAIIARRCNWTVAPAALEAVLSAQSFTLQGPQRRQLRRFLRKAQSAGLVYRPLNTDQAPADWSELATIHSAWENAHGKERGLTMGRFCPLFLNDKPLFGAYQNGRLIAFASAVTSDNKISLDVMRHTNDIPTGTMHGLVHYMIEWANSAGMEDVSLAAVPHPDHARYAASSVGLERFKASFAPTWHPLYIAAPSTPALLVAAGDLWTAIHHPAPIRYTLEEAWHLDAMLSGEVPARATDQSAGLRRAS